MSKFHTNIRTILKDVEIFLVRDLHDITLQSSARDRKNTILNNLHQLRQEYPELMTYDAVKPPAERQSVLTPSSAKDKPGKKQNKKEAEEAVIEETYAECDEPVVSGGADPGRGKEDSSSLYDEAEGSYKKDVSVADLQNPTMAGFLDKKRKKEGMKLLSMFNPFQRRYCVVKGNVFFYFASETETKQHGAILLTDYEARSYTEKGKEFAFELVAPAKRTYQFVAGSQEEMDKWISAVERGSTLTPEYADEDEIYAEADDFDIQPSRPAAKPPTMTTTTNPSGGVDEELYDDTAAAEEVYDDTLPEQPLPRSASGRGPPPPVPRGDEKGRGLPPSPSSLKGRDKPPPIPDSRTKAAEQSAPPPEEEEEEIYDDIENPEFAKFSPHQPQQDEVYDDTLAAPPTPKLPGGRGPPPPVPGAERRIPDPPPEIYDDASSSQMIEDDQEIYDDIAEPIDNGPVMPRNNSAKSPYATKAQPESSKEIEYEKIYCGIWDCKGEEDNELSFKRGDLIYIVNKDYDSYSWWVGELHGKVGLVPKDYLMEAYEAVIE